MKICKDCTNPCNDDVRFCVICGSNEFISEEKGGAEIPEEQLKEEVLEDSQPAMPASEMINNEENFEITNVKPMVVDKWPIWVKAAVFLMSSSILTIVAILLFTIIPVGIWLV